MCKTRKIKMGKSPIFFTNILFTFFDFFIYNQLTRQRKLFMNPIIGEAFGYICGLCTMVSFIPQAIKSIRTRNVSGLSLSMYLIYCTGLVFWILYGIYLKSIQMIICDVITLFFSGIILYMIIAKKSDKMKAV
jgi:MtN3 and saliva related transmembrane protein